MLTEKVGIKVRQIMEPAQSINYQHPMKVTINLRMWKLGVIWESGGNGSAFGKRIKIGSNYALATDLSPPYNCVIHEFDNGF